MNKLQSEICRILDFNEKYLQTALKEAISREKLTYTWMFVNGKLLYVDVIVPDENYVLASSPFIGPDKYEIESLEVWNPETGIYSCEECAILLIKKPLKQWKKSFHPNNYTYVVLKAGNTGATAEIYEKISKVKPEAFYVSKNNFFLYGNIIGAVKNNEVFNITPAYQIEATKYLQEKGIKCPSLL